MGPEGAAAGIGLGGVDALAALAEDAGPPRGEPGDVGADELVGVARIDELHPLTREVQGHLRHAHTLGRPGDRLAAGG